MKHQKEEYAAPKHPHGGYDNARLRRSHGPMPNCVKQRVGHRMDVVETTKKLFQGRRHSDSG